jgi:hypothetical protein
MDLCPVPLYHGTSTLFLSQIIEFGLGGKNPIAEWRVLELANRIWPLVQKHLAHEDDWMVGAQSFGWMCEQKAARMNFQHGQAYVSSSLFTATNYSIHNRYGSELLTYTLRFLKELVRRKIVDDRGDVSVEFSETFALLRASFAPMLVEVRDVGISSLLDELGNHP